MTRFTAPAAVQVLTLLAFCASAAAQTGPRLPYDGTLYLNGQPVEGQVALRMSLYDAVAGGNQLWQEAWTPETRPVTVRAGRFHVKLGSFVPLNPVLSAGRVAWLGIEVQPGGQGAWRALGGRQRLKLFPYAGRVTVGGGADFTVQDNLSAASLTATNQDLVARSLTVGGRISTGVNNVNDIGRSVVAGAVTADRMTGAQGAIRAPEFRTAGQAVSVGTEVSIRTINAPRGVVETPTLNLGQMDPNSFTLPGLRALGRFALRQLIAFDTNQVIINEAGHPLALEGPSLTCSGNGCAATAGDMRGTGGLTVNGPTTAGELNIFSARDGISISGIARTNTMDLGGCRICVQFVGRGGNRYACASLNILRSESGWVSPGDQFTSQTFMQIGIDCRSGQAAAGAGRVF